MTEPKVGDLFHFGDKCVRYLCVNDGMVMVIDERNEYQWRPQRQVVTRDQTPFWETQMQQCHLEQQCLRQHPVYKSYFRLAFNHAMANQLIYWDET